MTTQEVEREYITTVEAARLTDMSRNYFARLLRTGKLEGFKPSRDWFVYTDSLKQFLAEKRKPGPRGPRNSSR